MDVSPYLVMYYFLLAMNRWVSGTSKDTYDYGSNEELREDDG